MDKINFSYGVIASVGILIAISIAFIGSDPDDVIQPRMASIQEVAVPETEQRQEPPLDAGNDISSAPVDETETDAVPETHEVDIALDSGIPGCDESNECYLPYSINISIGDTVIWNNPDKVLHTVTDGTPQEGGGELFNSLLAVDETFEFTFDVVGTVDYYCVVHPWMTGIVVVG